MRLHRDVVIESILKHQKSFFRILDYINENTGAKEVPASFYLNLYREEIQREAERIGDPNSYAHLSIASLLENGVFVYHNKSTGKIALNNTIIDLLQFIDVSRTRELSQKDLELLRANIETAVDGVMNTEFDTERYEDAMRAFYGAINESLSKMRGNVERLAVKVDAIAQDFKDYEENRNVPIAALYGKIQALYERYILPCYQFLNPDVQLVAKKTFSESMDALIRHHESRGAESTAHLIGYNKTSVSSYFKDISELETKLKHYSTRLEGDRKFYASVEAAYSILMESVNELRHGKQKGYLLNADSPVFSYFRSLDGIETHRAKFDAGLAWHPEKSISQLNEFLITIDAKSTSEHKKELKPLPDDIDLEEFRKIEVAGLVSSFDLNSEQDDIYDSVTQYLKDRLPDFSLVDLLFGMEYIHDLHDENIVITSYERASLDDGTYYLNYLPVALRKGMQDDV